MPGVITSAHPALQALSALQSVVLVRDPATATYQAIGPVPDWWAEWFGSVDEFQERSPFLDDFTNGLATEFWNQTTPGEAILPSGIWEETNGDNRRFFEAIATRNNPVSSKENPSQLLIVQVADERWRNEQTFVQSAHDQSLDRRRLLKEIEKRQVLLECIMHDLGTPVATVLMSLQHIARHLSEQQRGLQTAVQRAIAQSNRQRQLIRSIAEVFSSDLSVPSDLDPNHPDVPDLNAIVAATSSSCADIATAAGVTICPFFGGQLLVRGEKLALSRIVENLLMNAIRHSPSGRCVTVRLSQEGSMAVCQVEDAGSGIEPELLDRLFQPFVQGKKHPGQSGLGLYYCRMTIEKWGGTIQGWNRDKGGACFEFRLPIVRKGATT